MRDKYTYEEAMDIIGASGYILILFAYFYSNNDLSKYWMLYRKTLISFNGVCKILRSLRE